MNYNNKDSQTLVVWQKFWLISIFITAIFMQSCVDKCQTTTTYTYFQPVYQTTEEIRQAFEIQGPRDLVNPGKIYLMGNFLFINEIGEGIHLINNSDPSQPIKMRFINIPGNYDLAAKGNMLYADNYIDLLAINIGDLTNIKLEKRVENVFPLFNNQWDLWMVGPPVSNEVVLTGWEEQETVEINDNCDDAGGNMFFLAERVAVPTADVGLFNTSVPGGEIPGGTDGIGGSMARFAITNDFLYTVDSYQLTVFDISVLTDPVQGNVINMGWGIETIFPYKDKLFIGAQNGMHIYDNAIPTEPVYLSSFLHVTTCDPVVVNDQYAYVTLRSGTACNGFTNQLDVINIENLDNPFLVASHPMDNPHGLGLDGTTLFISEGDFGLKIFEASDPETISDNLIKYVQDIHGFDVIPNDGVLLVIGNDGLYQYDYKDLNNIELLSVLPVNRDQ